MSRKSRRSPERICRSKKAWSTEVKAKVHALGVMNHPVKAFRATVPIYVYRCDVCGLWHLTKKPRTNTTDTND